MLVPPASGAFSITPSDSVNFVTMARGIYVGTTGGTITVLLNKDTGQTIQFTAVPAGSILPINCWRVNSTGTSATPLIGLL